MISRKASPLNRVLKRPGVAVGRLVVIVLYLFLLAPIIAVVILSFNSGPSITFPMDGFTLDWFVELANNQAFRSGAMTSLITATLVTLGVLAMGVPAAFAINRYKFRGRGFFSGLFMAPLLVPTVVMGLSLLLVLAPFGLTGTHTGIVIAHLGLCTPYVVRTTLMSLETSDVSSEEAARVLGANPWQVFGRITLPIIMPGVIAGAVMSFIISFDEAVISMFVAGSGQTTLPVEMFNHVEQRTDPEIAALATVLVSLSILVVVVVERVLGLRRAL